MKEYNFAAIESKWQQVWQEKEIFKTTISSKQKYYVLEMFPYPSGKIHMGHLRNYSLGDAVARYKTLKGYNVLHPIGWDAFGLPAENAAVERSIMPNKWTYNNIESMKQQLLPLGFSYDWGREIATCSPEYYKHGQEIFIDFLKNNLAYQKQAEVNWDPVDNTVLANEQVIDGKGWRSGAIVEKRKLKQWFLKVTDFAEELDDEIKNLKGWPEAVRAIQKKWIGKSSGLEIIFNVKSINEKLTIYTTRAETIYGMGFCAISPQHPLAIKIAEENEEAANFIKECVELGTSEEVISKTEKKGFDTGLTVNHPLLPDEYKLYIANFVLMDYGTGAIFGCPAHDERDFEFATKYSLPVKQVIAGDSSLPFSEGGKLINSESLDGLDILTARERISELVESANNGKKKTNYRLRDWGISRQRYWGCPIPIIYCDDCGVVPVDKKDLPVKLPDEVDFSKTGNPLLNHPTWKHTSCPKCSKAAIRETDTFDTFFESSWYFLRFCNPSSSNVVDQENVNYWMEVDQYIGGIEHAALHLLYARFFTKALRNCGYINISEPFKNLLTQGMVLHETYKDSEGNWLYPEEAKDRLDVIKGRVEKMSKSKKNTVDPSSLLAKYGADSARLFMLSDCPPERDMEWSDSGIDGSYKYLKKIWKFVDNYIENTPQANDKIYQDNIGKVHFYINEISKHMEKMHFNNAVASIRECSNFIFTINEKKLVQEALDALVIMMSPIVPHIAEELWQKLGHSNLLSDNLWPKADMALLQSDKAIIVVQINGKIRAKIEAEKSLSQEKIEKLALSHDNVVKFIGDKKIRKIIYIPGKILNVVI